MHVYRVLDQQCVVPFVWVGRVLALSSRRVVPGDVVVLQRGKATCDMVLLRGAGLVEESMLSGEVSSAGRHLLVGVGRGGGGGGDMHRGRQSRGFCEPSPVNPAAQPCFLVWARGGGV